MNTIQAPNGNSIRSPRAAQLRTKDAYFDALCETYLDLGQRISRCGKKGNDVEALEDQRANCLDTIMYMLADDEAASHAHRLH